MKSLVSYVVLTLALLDGKFSSGQQIVRSNLDFTKATPDPQTGELCLLQKVCLSNPEELAKLLPQEPCPDPYANEVAPEFPPGRIIVCSHHRAPHSKHILFD